MKIVRKTAVRILFRDLPLGDWFRRPFDGSIWRKVICEHKYNAIGLRNAGVVELHDADEVEPVEVDVVVKEEGTVPFSEILPTEVFEIVDVTDLARTHEPMIPVMRSVDRAWYLTDGSQVRVDPRARCRRLHGAFVEGWSEDSE